MAAAKRDIVVFDLGGVPIQWDPRHPYRKPLANADAASAPGIHGIRFTTPEALRAELVTLGLLP